MIAVYLGNDVAALKKGQDDLIKALAHHEELLEIFESNTDRLHNLVHRIQKMVAPYERS